MTITKDFVADYGADNTGVASVTTKLYTNLKTDMQGQDVNLTFPAGSYNNASFGGDGGSWINGVRDLNVTATGATLFGNGGVFLSTSHIQQNGIDTALGKNARIQTVYPGATSVTLTSASASAGHISRFSIGQKCLVVGWAIQAAFQQAFSFPPNWHWAEFVTITGISGDTVTFTPALQNYYSDQWPELNRGSQFETDASGPATLVGLSQYYGGTSTFNDGTYTNSQLINCYRENFIMNGGTSSSLPIYPSVNKLWRAVNHTATSALVEHDKLNDWVDVQGGTYSQWKCQSSSTRLLTMTGVTITGSLNGTVRNTIVDNCSIGTGLIIGPVSYGRGETFIARNTSIGGTITGGLTIKGGSDGLSSDVGVQGYMSKSGSVIKIPMCMGDLITSPGMPNANGSHVLWWQGSFGPFGYWRSLSVTSDSWPATDNQTSSVAITIANGSKTLSVASPIFSSADVGKVILIPKMVNNSNYTNCTISNASPGVITLSSHGKVANEPIRFRAGSGTLPSGITAGTVYYVSATGLTSNTFTISATVGGAQINTSGGSGTVQVSFVLDVYTFITGFTDSQTVTIYHANTNFDFSSVTVGLQWGTCNAYIQTDSTDPMPDPSLYTSGKLFLTIPPARSVSFENCTDSNSGIFSQAEDLSQASARGRPLWSYTKRTYNGSFGFSGPSIKMVGNVVSIKVNVTKAYTGAGVLYHRFSGFDNLKVVQNGAYVDYGGRFDLKTLGERVVTIGSTTGSGGADQNIGLSVPTWLCGASSGLITMQVNKDISAEDPATWPSYTIEIITDQGFPAATAVAPLRLRFRAA